jgi:tRNA (cytidine/uridine-2'-O-)-methyltransferase
MIDIALYQPDIAQNTATIIRLSACLGLRVHIIEPAGFIWGTKDFRRAGMDYLDQAEVIRHADWTEFLAASAGRRIVLATTGAAVPYTSLAYRCSDILLFGRESSGVPTSVSAELEAQVRIPIRRETRSLNVAVAAAMIAGEALRQTTWVNEPVS